MVTIPGDKGAIATKYEIAVNKLTRKQLKKVATKDILRWRQQNQKENLAYDLTQRYELGEDGKTKTPIPGDEGAIKAQFQVDKQQVEHDKKVVDVSNELKRLKQAGVLDKLVYDLVQRWSLDEKGNRVNIEGNKGALLDLLTQYKAEQKAGNTLSEIERMIRTDKYQ